MTQREHRGSSCVRRGCPPALVRGQTRAGAADPHDRATCFAGDFANRIVAGTSLGNPSAPRTGNPDNATSQRDGI